MENHSVHPIDAKTIKSTQAQIPQAPFPETFKKSSVSHSVPEKSSLLTEKIFSNEQAKTNGHENTCFSEGFSGQLKTGIAGTPDSSQAGTFSSILWKNSEETKAGNGHNEFQTATAHDKTFRALTLKEILPQWGYSPEKIKETLRTEQSTGFPMALSQHFTRLAGIPKNEALRKQVLPSSDELMEKEHFTTNPLEEQAPSAKNFSPIFLLQKYAGRALMMTSMECFGNCRFCFRRHLRTSFPSKQITREHFASALNTLTKDTSIHEIILSGGDPLTLENELFFWLLMEFQKIEHLKRIRVHTRAPIFFPEKISEKFSKNLKAFSRQSEKPLYFVLHINHPAELSEEVVLAIQRLHESGATLLQQGVLLRGVNDQTEVLADLYEKLIQIHVIPYYLHQLDRVKGAAHFETEVEKGRKIVTELRALLPGFAVPRYVREVPGESGKVPLD
ncbi:MAG: KamA family radical SAM protein [Planctomycetaceae bacterium]|nr:KamA family radical SAM protein [Planctomycetaceae bacterium]